MAADVPAYPAPYTTLTVSEASDAGGTLADVLGKHNNKHDERIAAMSADLISAFGVDGAATMLALVTAILGPTTDNRIIFGGEDWKDSGSAVWVPDSGPNGGVLRRTPSGSGESAQITIPLSARAAVDKGVRLTSFRVVYAVTVAAVATDVALTGIVETLNGDGVAPSQVALVGTLDAAHDSAVERGAIGEHTMTLTVTTPVFLPAGSVYRFTLNVDDNTGGTAAVDIRAADLIYDYAPLDGS